MNGKYWIHAALLALFLAGAPALCAAVQTPPPPVPQVHTAPAPAQPENTPKTEQYTLSRDRYEKAVAFSRSQYILYFVSFFYGLLVLILILRLGLAAQFRNLAERFSDGRFLQSAVFVPLLLLTLSILDLPISVYRHSLSLRYELSVQTWGSWLWDWTKDEMIGLLFGFLLITILFAVIRRSPRRCWLYFWMAALPIAVAAFFISPWLIDPLFNKFEPLGARHPELVTAIEKVVRRAGMDIPREKMFLMQASVKSNAINAYVTGFGASKRVVVWDTTIEKTTPNETLFIFGHEMGHYVLNHVRNGFLFAAAMLLGAFYVAFRGLHWALDRWARLWKVRGMDDWAALPAMLAILSLILFFASPVINGFSRMQEAHADIYGLEVIHGLVPDSAEVAAHAFQVLGEVDLSDPNPPDFITFWLYSHPPVADRLVFAHTYDPWSEGKSPQYVN